jgi:glycosyltransferase involved in cell wall biosynthesis
MRRRLCFVVESGADVRLVEGLAERFELTVLARRIEGGVEISQETGSEFGLMVGPSSRAGFARLVWKTLRKRGGEFDYVLAQGYGAAALAANLAGRLRDVPVFMLVCSPVERYYLCRRAHGGESKPFRRRELLGVRLLARANAFAGRHYFVLSRHLAGVVRGHGTRRPVEVLPLYGVDTEIFRPARESKREVRERLGLHAGGSLVFFSSRVAPEKDAETLLAAVRILLERGHDIRLLHRSGGHRAFLEDARRFGLDGRVDAADALHPHRELADAYRASDLCVQASREEGLGFSPLEALACGTPVVAADVGGLRETIVDGETGWSYTVGDAEALARCIEEALGDTLEAARRTAAGRALVRERYERRAVFGRLLEALEAFDGRGENTEPAARMRADSRRAAADRAL